MAGHLLIRKVEKKSFSLTNWKKRRVVFSGARFVVYKPGQDSASECKKCAPGAVLIPVQCADVPLSLSRFVVVEFLESTALSKRQERHQDLWVSYPSRDGNAGKNVSARYVATV